jgi:hypothetical protein
MPKLPMVSMLLDKAQQELYLDNKEEAAAILKSVEMELREEEKCIPERVKLFHMKGMQLQCQRNYKDAVLFFEGSLQLQIELSGKGALHHSCWYAYRNLAFANLCVENYEVAKNIFLQQQQMIPLIRKLMSRKLLWQEGRANYALTTIIQGDISEGVTILEDELTALETKDRRPFIDDLIKYNLLVASDQSILKLPEDSLKNLGVKDFITETNHICTPR